MTNIALIPLRDGSKSISKKNIKLLAGRPLCAWALEAVARCESINSVFVSTDSDEIADVVQGLGLGIQVISRPKEFATDEASTEVVMLHFMRNVDFDALVTIQATSPLLSASDLDRALVQFRVQRLDSMLSAVRTKRFFWHDDATPINYDPLHRPRRQDFPGTLMENGAFYVTCREILQRHKCRLGGKVGIYEMDESTAIEIDEPEDWERVEKLLLERKG
jgi:N-acylneuraminate cytidylyltransferase